MTVAAISSTQTVYSPAGTASVFATVWPYAVAADVSVWVSLAAGAPLMALSPANYTLAPLGSGSLAAGGQVTVSAAWIAGQPGGHWPAGSTLAIRRSTLKAQPSHFGSIDYLSPAAVEASDDNLERQIQDNGSATTVVASDLAALTARAIMAPVGKLGFIVPTPPVANTVLGFDGVAAATYYDKATFIGPVGPQGPQGIPGTAGFAVYADDYGAVANDLATDSAAAIRYCVNTFPVTRLRGYAYRMASALVIPDGHMLVGDMFLPNLDTPAGSRLVFDAGVATCVQIGSGGGNLSAGLDSVIIDRAGGAPPAGSIGILVKDGYCPALNRVGSRNHAVCVYWKNDGYFGITSHSRGLYTALAGDAHLVVDNWPELFITQGRLGVNGAADYNCNAYLRITGGSGPGAPGPNGVFLSQVQMNQGLNVPAHAVEWVNMGDTVSNALEYKFDQCHLEGVGAAFFYSDATCANLHMFDLTSCTLNNNVPIFALNPATRLVVCNITNNAFAGPLTLAPTQPSTYVTLTGNACAQPVDITSPAGGQVSMANNAWLSLTIRGGGGFAINGDSLQGGGFTNNATGVVVCDGCSFSGRRGWQPTVLFGGASAGQAYTAREGDYEYITASLVRLSFQIILSNKGTSAGALAIGGLPTPVSATFGASGGGAVPYYSAMQGLTGCLLMSATSDARITFWQSAPTGIAQVFDTHCSNGSVFYGTVYYQPS